MVLSLLFGLLPLVAIQNIAMRLSQYSDDRGAGDGGGTETFSGSNGGGVKTPQVKLVIIYEAFSGSYKIGSRTSRYQ